MKMRARFIAEALAQVGSPYRYGGRGEPVPALDLNGGAWPWPAQVPRHFDCSGLVAWAWLLATGLDWRREGHCDVLLARSRRVDVPSNGSLVFYGRQADAVQGVKQDAQHVTIYVDGCVVGANGGDSTTLTLQRAQAQKARVCLRNRADYRTDVLGFYELPFSDEVVKPTQGRK